MSSFYKLGVIGSPIGHSLSPKIHKTFANNLGLQVSYEAIEVKENGGEGEILDDKLTVGCSLNSIQILRIQKEGKREMDVKEFLTGNNLKKGTKLN